MEEFNNMLFFGWFKGLPYRTCDEDFETFKTYKNSIPKEKVIAHLEKLEPALACLQSFDMFTGEELVPGMFVDGKFRFPYEFLHFYKNYDIGIPYEYEEYLKTILK